MVFSLGLIADATLHLKHVVLPVTHFAESSDEKELAWDLHRLPTTSKYSYHHK